MQKGKTTERSTDATMSDKSRYNVTRFAGENNAIYDADGEEISGGYEEAYSQTREAAEHIQATGTGRTKGRAYIYDTEISPGNGRLTDEAAHRMVAEYTDILKQQGYRVEGVQYVIHQNTQHTHVHMMFATQKTIQKTHDSAAKYHMRTVADRLRTQEQDRTLDASREMVAEVQQGREKGRGY